MASAATRYLAPTTASALKTRGTKPPMQVESRLYALHARGGGLVLPGEERFTASRARSSSPPHFASEAAASSAPAVKTTSSQRLAARVGVAAIRKQRARLTPALRASLRASRCGEPPWSVAQCKSILRRFLHQMSTAPLAELRELITLDQAVAIAGLRSANEPPLADGGASLYGQVPSSLPPSGAGGIGAPSPSAAARGAARSGMLRASSDAADGLAMQLNDSVITLLLDALAQSEERSALRSKFVDALAADR